MPRPPRIAVLLDENTSSGGTKYEAAKGYFHGLADAGALPFGVPYLPQAVDPVLADFDGLVCVGGRFAYPDSFYVGGQASLAPPNDRLGTEQALMRAFVGAGKPVLGLCAGMQLLACLHGARMTPNLREALPTALEHDLRGSRHPIHLTPGSRLAAILGRDEIEVNTFHREAVWEPGERIVVSARAPDGIIEAVELPGPGFAVGLQWHQELHAAEDHPGNAVFRAFVEAAASR